MTDYTPTRKITAVVLGGAVATIAAWLLGALTTLDVPPGVESAFAVVVAFGFGWATEDAS